VYRAHGHSSVCPQQDAATVVSRQDITDRLVELRVHSDALHQVVGVRLLLPKDWKRFSYRKWPTLYLLHGCCDGDTGFRSWTDKTDVTAFTANTNALIVMPEGGTVGFYSNWYDGSVDWERFHLTELRRLLEREFHAGGPRAVAGLSMGGFGGFPTPQGIRGSSRPPRPTADWWTPPSAAR
jgi:S-formylglutathione hydrolase FrmB